MEWAVSSQLVARLSKYWPHPNDGLAQAVCCPHGPLFSRRHSRAAAMAAQLRVALGGMQRRVQDMQNFLDDLDHVDSPKKMTVELPPPHKPITIDVLPTDNVARTKDRIARSCGIPPDHQLLTYNGVRLMPPWKNMGDWWGMRDAPLIVMPQIQIYVLMKTGKIITVDAASWDTVASVKSEIEIKQKVPVDSQRLIFDGDELLNEQTLEMCNVFRYSQIHLRIVGGAPNRTKG